MALTKVQAVVAFLKKNKGQATWAQIYEGIEKFYPMAKSSDFWQEGIRGVVYREMRYERTFKFAGKGVIALR
jgi:hypothetical protein